MRQLGWWLCWATGVTLLYRTHQIDPNLSCQIIDLDTEIQETFSTYRGKMDGQAVTMSDIYTLYPWADMIDKATGQPLTPDHFVKQFLTF